MKTLKIMFCLVIAGLVSVSATAQSYEHQLKGAKKLIIKELSADLTIAGHSGSTLVINVSDLDPVPEKATGLTPLYNSKQDNTGVGLVIEEVEGNLVVSGARKQAEDAEYELLVPAGLAVKVDYSSPVADDITIKDFKNEIDIYSLNSDIDLAGINGPAIIYTINGDINLVYDKVSQAAPHKITTINGEVDVTMPSSTATNISLKTMHGEAFTNFDIKFEEDEDEKDEKEMGLSHMGGRKTNGTINGGGVEIEISSINDNVYLRKK